MSYEITRLSNGQIVSIKSNTGLEIRLGERVYSNGRIFVPRGTLGIVVEIRNPRNGDSAYEEHKVLSVFWEGSYYPCPMKFKDLNFVNGKMES